MNREATLTSPTYDLIYLQAAIDSLKDFLLVEDLFWPIGANPPAGGSPFPRLTMGGLLLSNARLKARRLPLDLETKLIKLSNRMQSISSEWQTAWENKAARAFQMRLTMWRDFIEEYRKDPESNADRYSYEVRLRVMLQLLLQEISLLNSAEQDLITGLDLFLRTVLVRSDFLWESDISGGFPQDVYWYLYGQLPDEPYKY
jgi:hypothetical protein